MRIEAERQVKRDSILCGVIAFVSAFAERAS